MESELRIEFLDLAITPSLYLWLCNSFFSFGAICFAMGKGCLESTKKTSHWLDHHELGLVLYSRMSINLLIGCIKNHVTMLEYPEPGPAHPIRPGTIFKAKKKGKR